MPKQRHIDRRVVVPVISEVRRPTLTEQHGEGHELVLPLELE